MKKLIMPLLISTVLAACSSTQINSDGATSANNGNEGTNKIASVVVGDVDASGLPKELTDKNSVLSKRSVYFDFDQFSVDTKYGELISAHAKFLNNNKNFKVLIQGNTDERGGTEYNLSLGQKRSEAVKKSLVLLGAKEEQVEAVSLGKEKPKAVGSTEEAWAENRRADILYKNDKGQGEF